MRRMLIRADASLSMGTGHVMRCLALAQAWQDAGGDAALNSQELPAALRDRLEKEGVTVVQSGSTPGSAQDAIRLGTQAAEMAAQWIVVDGDQFDTHFLQTLRDSGNRVLLIDDLAARPGFPVDLLVNPNFGAHAEDYSAKQVGSRVLAGPAYALLRREFRRRWATKVCEQTKRILVTLGGSDPEQLTPRIVDALADSSDLEVTVVAGGAYAGWTELVRRAGKRVRLFFNPPDMAGLMAQADVAITASGGTIWELLSVGCPVLCYWRGSQGMRLVNSLALENVVVNMGEISCFEASLLKSAVREFWELRFRCEEMVRRGRALVDGSGAERVVHALRSLAAGDL